MSGGRLILLVDDEASVLYTLEAVLRKDGYRILKAQSGPEALTLFRQHEPSLVISDYNMPGMNGVDVLKAIRETSSRARVILMTAYGSEALAVEAMKLGAYDYLSKPFANDDLRLTVRRALDHTDLEERNRQLTKLISESPGLENIVGSSDGMKRVYELVAKVAPQDVTVLITGESGTGKELVSCALHRMSHRSDGPFIRVNCAALPETLIESELFGYERGAFSGAVARRQGKFELADHGTIFLDEIGDMSLTTQTKILRIMQEREFERLGGQETIRVDTRVIAATNRDLQQAIRDGAFREELFYRLNVVSIHLPPLRERRSDIPLLLEHFAARFRRKFNKPNHTFSAGFLHRLQQYAWPGNVREFQSVIERAIILDDETVFGDIAGRGGPVLPLRVDGAVGAAERAGGLTVDPGAPPTPATGQPPGADEPLLQLPYREAKEQVLERFERRYFGRLLEQSGRNISRAAAQAGMHRKNLYTKLKELGLLTREREGAGEGGDPAAPPGGE